MRLESQADFGTWKIKMTMVTQVRNGKGLKEDMKTKAIVCRRSFIN